MTRGVLMYAHNNSEIDYLKIACANALMVKKNLDVGITLVTDSKTLQWGEDSLSAPFINSCFDNVIEVDKNKVFINNRIFSDTSYTNKILPFYNCNHWQAYALSPYDETLFIDCDYLIMSSALARCWDSGNDIMVNRTIYSPIDDAPPYSKLIDNSGIPLYWATVVYFKKSLIAENLFYVVRHVEENYEYYKNLYCFSSGMFRNDYAMSIAVHTLNGYNNTLPVIRELPISGLLMSWDKDDIQNVNSINDITIYAEKKDKTGEYILSRIKNTDIHIMNKWAISRVTGRLIELYGDDTCLEDI